MALHRFGQQLFGGLWFGQECKVPRNKQQSVLLQRGETTSCSKLAACVDSNGIGAILCNRADQHACEHLTAIDLSIFTAPNTWPVAVTTLLRQREAINGCYCCYQMHWAICNTH